MAKSQSNPEASDACLCSSGIAWELCCGPLVEGRAEASNPEQLMRSRFCAFVLGQRPGAAEYLHQTLHKDHDEAGVPQAEYCARLREGLKTLRYSNLQICDSTNADSEGVAQVLFSVDVREGKKDLSFIELSSFVRHTENPGGWRYLFGAVVPREGVEEPGSLRIGAPKE